MTRAGAALVALLLGGCAHTLPVGATAGPEADSLARRIERAVDKEAWARTGAVHFYFRDDTEHLWDRTRSLDRVRFLGSDEVVLIDLTTRRGRAYKKGKEIEGAARDKLVQRAWERWCNDTFWLNPLVKLFDDGVTRTRVVNRDGESLIVHYASGGVTPGDSYQYLMGPGDLPRAWRMFVSVIRIPGLELTWEGWQTLKTGAKVSTRHRLGKLGLKLREAAGAASLAELLPGPDPFAAIVETR
jgi:hypothetical protein